MNIFILIIIAIAGIGLGMYFGRKKSHGSLVEPPEQSRKKAENKEKILRFLSVQQAQDKQARIKNDDVEELLGVSDATAERYLDELEKEGKLLQHGKIGQSVFYTPK